MKHDMIKPIEAVILAGGKGTRLSSVISDIPKPLAPVAGRPFLDHLVDQLTADGIMRRIIFSTGYMANKITDWANTRSCDSILECIEEFEPLGTGGALLNAADTCVSETILVSNGDSMVRVSFKSVLEEHYRMGFSISMVVVNVANTSRYGKVELDANRVIAFKEKDGSSEPGYINAGIYVINRDCLKSFPRTTSSFETDILPSLIEGGIGAYVTDLPFCDIGIPDSYYSAQSVLSL